jgi:hypothetical protein
MSSRTIEFTVDNQTGQKLVLDGLAFNHGKVIVAPTDIDSATKCVFKVGNKDWAWIGVEGTVSWKGADDLGAFSIYFFKPISTGPTKIDPACPEAYKHETEGDPSGHHSQVTVTFSKRYPEMSSAELDI